MLKSGPWLLTSLLFLPVGSLVAQVLPEPGGPPAVDTITPVPAPEIPYGALGPTESVMPKDLKISNLGGTIEGDPETGLRLGGPVKIEGDNGLEVFSRTAVLDLKGKTVTLNGDVTVYQGNLMQRGERAVYHYEEKFLDTSGLRASLDPILLEAGKFTVETQGNKQVYTGHDAGITTHDVENPDYWIRAGETRVYPGEKVIFKDMKIYAGDVPVLWLPYLSQTLDPNLGYHALPGGRSNWGPYLLNTYGIMLGGEKDPYTGENHDAWLLSRWHLDLRATRGLGVGADFRDIRMENREEFSGLGLYYLHDMDPGDSRTGVSRGDVDPERYRVELKHRIKPDFSDHADWRIDSNLTLLSDRYYLEDFEPDRYRFDPEPDNTLGIYRRTDSSLLSLYMRFQLNDFYRADTRLPEITYDRARAPLFGLPLLHEGSTSFGLIGEEAADVTQSAIIHPLSGMTLSDPGTRRLLDQLSGYERRLAEAMVALPLGDPKRESIRTQLMDPSYARFRTYQEISYPMMLGGFLSFTPQAGFGYSYYGAVDGPENDLDRTHLHVGAETSMKFSKDLGGYRNHALGLDGLLHVFQPYGSWSVVSTNDFEPGDPAVDRLTPTTRPRPLDPVRFTAVDEMQSWNVLRFGARNRLMTKRDGQTFEWLYLDTYMDAFVEDPEGKRNFSNLYNDVRWQPVPWMNVDLETQFPIADGGSGFSEFNSRMRFFPTDRFEFSVGYRWLSGHPVLQDSSLVHLSSYTRLTENWGVGTSHALELDDGTLEYQQYSLHHDLGNWVAGIGVTARDNRIKNEYGLMFSLTLKDFPAVSLPFQLDAQ